MRYGYLKTTNWQKTAPRFSGSCQRVEKVSTRWTEVEKGRQIFRFCIRRRTGVRQSAKTEKARKHKAFSMIALCLFVLCSFFIVYAFFSLSLRSNSFFDSLESRLVQGFFMLFSVCTRRMRLYSIPLCAEYLYRSVKCNTRKQIRLYTSFSGELSPIGARCRRKTHRSQE